MNTRDLFITYTSQEMWTLYALAVEGKVDPKESCILALFDFELIGIDQDIKTSRNELISEFKRLGFKVESKLFWANRLVMAQEVLKSRTTNKFLRKAIFDAVQYTRDIDIKNLKQFNKYERIFITGPSHPLSALMMQHKLAKQEVLMFPETLWHNSARMQMTANFQKLNYLAFDSKDMVSDFYKLRLAKKMRLEKQIASSPNNSILIFPEYVEPIVRRDEYAELYRRLFEKLYAMNYSSFLFKFHPRSTKGDNQCFLAKVKSRANPAWNISVIDSCLDLQLWASACRDTVVSKVVAAATVSSTAAEVFAAEIGQQAFYNKELYKELYILNAGVEEGLPIGPQESPNVVFI
jgi:hypothetical protein